MRPPSLGSRAMRFTRSAPTEWVRHGHHAENSNAKRRNAVSWFQSTSIERLTGGRVTSASSFGGRAQPSLAGVFERATAGEAIDACVCMSRKHIVPQRFDSTRAASVSPSWLAW